MRHGNDVFLCLYVRIVLIAHTRVPFNLVPYLVQSVRPRADSQS